jgi:hypothetical protein
LIPIATKHRTATCDRLPQLGTLISRNLFTPIAVHRTRCTRWSLAPRPEGEANHEDRARHLTPTKVIAPLLAQHL